MITHVIYHIDGRKVGCTKNLEGRKAWYPRGTVLEVIEELHDKTDQEAGNVEWQWADRLGYSRGSHYTKTMVSETVENRRERHSSMGKKGGSIGGRKGGLIASFKMTTDQKLEFSRMGRERLAQLPPERRSEIGRKAGLAGGRKGGLARVANSTPEQRSEWGRRGTIKRSVCPHCGHENIMGVLARFHLDKCKSR